MAVNRHITQIYDNKDDLLAGMEEWQFAFMTDNSDFLAAASQVNAPCHTTEAVAELLVHAITKTVDPSTGAEEYLPVEFGKVYATLEDAVGDDISYPLVLTHLTTGSISTGIGTGILFQAEGDVPYDYEGIGRIAFTKQDGASLIDSGFVVQTRINAVYTNAIRVDYMGQVGIGSGIASGAFDAPFHICPQSASINAPTYTVVAIENNNDSWLSFLTPNNKSAGIVWGDPDDDDVASIKYNHSDNTITVTAGGAAVATVDSARLTIVSGKALRLGNQAQAGTITPDKTLIVEDSDGNQFKIAVVAAA